MREEVQGKLELVKEEVVEEEDEAPQLPMKKSRFSASSGDGQQDGMTVVDGGVSEHTFTMTHKKIVYGLPSNFGEECNAGLACLSNNGIGT
jgi:hypothetical protein